MSRWTGTSAETTMLGEYKLASEHFQAVIMQHQADPAILAIFHKMQVFICDASTVCGSVAYTKNHAFVV